MPSSRDIKRRIKGVESMEQITKAMKLVATSKVQKSKKRVEINRFYFENMMSAIKDGLGSSSNSESIFLKKKIINGKKRVLYVLLSSDRGLCGGYNINLFKELKRNLNDEDENLLVISGRKAKEYCKRNNLNVVFEKVGISENPTYTDAKEIGNFVINKFVNNEVDEIVLVYTHFISIITQEQKTYKLLPFENTQGDVENSEKKVGAVTLYEPGMTAVLDYVIPKYVTSVIYGALLEAFASEEGSRMTAMDNATTNAEDIVSELTLSYNRLRQGSITTEISEIVGGANALNA